MQQRTLMNELNMIRVWRFQDAPDNLRYLSSSGGDEDWLALIPIEMKDDYIPWMESGSTFGCCSVDEYSSPEMPGFIVRIGRHA